MAIAVKAGAVTGTVPAELVGVPLQLTAQVGTANIHGVNGSVWLLTDPQFLPIQKDDAAVTPWNFCRLFGWNLKGLRAVIPVLFAMTPAGVW
mgnify:CR=1 FL=1